MTIRRVCDGIGVNVSYSLSSARSDGLTPEAQTMVAEDAVKGASPKQVEVFRAADLIR